MGKREKGSGVGTLTAFVSIVFLTVIAYTVTALWFNWHGREIQDSVSAGFYGLFGAEFGVTGVIQVVKLIRSMRGGSKAPGDERDDN